MKKRIAFLVTHGTDTMAWGLSYLNYTLKNMAFNICLVGSQIPLEDTPNGSDGYLNLETAVFALFELSHPRIMVSMNSGRQVFEHDVWKTDKWDTNSFSGGILIEKRSNQIIFNPGLKLQQKKPIDLLYIIKTGGTIEESMIDDVLKPDKTKDSVTKFILERFTGQNNSCFIKDIESYSLMAEDSSDMITELWDKIVNFIVEKSKENGYNAYKEKGISENVSVLFSTPLNKHSDYNDLINEKQGFVFLGYGGGNVNIKKKDGIISPYSPLPLFENIVQKNGFTILSSHPVGGILDPLYENGREVFERRLAIPSMDFSIARAQIKLSYILGNYTKLLKFIPQSKKQNRNSIERIVAILFLSGSVFARKETRQYFENLWHIRIPEKDLLMNFNFNQALKLLEKYLHPVRPRRFKFDKDFSLISNDIKKAVLILKPDDIVGENLSGEEIDASENIAFIVEKGFEWNIISADITEKIDNSSKLDSLLNKIRIIFSEGGRQSVYDKETFDELNKFASKAKMISVFKKIIENRSLSANSAPGIFICLSHQLMAESLFMLVNDVVDNTDVFSRNQESIKIDFNNIVKKIIDMRTKVFENRTDYFSVVKKNERPETLIVDLKRYQPSEHIISELVETHNKISHNFSGLIEDFIEIEKTDIAMLHGDEVSEEGILFVNWALNQLHKFRNKYAEKIDKKNLLWKIPAGVEITSSTWDADGILTEAGSLAVYYIDSEGYLYRDFTFQFHPELMIEDEIRELYSDSEIKLSYQNDGFKILISAIMASFERIKIN